MSMKGLRVIQIRVARRMRAAARNGGEHIAGRIGRIGNADSLPASRIERSEKGEATK